MVGKMTKVADRLYKVSADRATQEWEMLDAIGQGVMVLIENSLAYNTIQGEELRGRVKMLNEAKESQVIWPAILWELNVCNRRIQPA